MLFWVQLLRRRIFAGKRRLAQRPRRARNYNFLLALGKGVGAWIFI
jgi:hypothetical protein